MNTLRKYYVIAVDTTPRQYLSECFKIGPRRQDGTLGDWEPELYLSKNWTDAKQFKSLAKVEQQLEGLRNVETEEPLITLQRLYGEQQVFDLRQKSWTQIATADIEEADNVPDID